MLVYKHLLKLKNILKINRNSFTSVNVKMSEQTSVASSTEQIEKKDKPENNPQYNKKYSNFDKTRFSSYQEAKEDTKRKLKERRAAKTEKKDVGFSNDILNQTDYYFENGLRKVYPYMYNWITFVKERWFNRTLLDIYTTEFFRATASLCVKSLIESGKIRVNDQVKSVDYIIKNGDKITHVKHRHEIPVLASPIKILHEDADYLVVDKPCSIPMHPCGKYRYNSLNIILVKEFGYTNLRSIFVKICVH
jgi:hypothetical protein